MSDPRRSDAQFKKKIRFACYDALEREGFTRFRKEGVDWPIHDGFHCWVGLNTALDRDRVEVLPFVGVHVVPMMKLFALKGGKYAFNYDRGIATYSINMGLLESVADERAFAFAPEQSEGFIESECGRLAHLYATAGLEYARSIANYEVLLPLLQGQIDRLGGYPERVASCLYLMGRKVEAKEFVEDFLKGQYREYIEHFAIPFLDLLDREGVTKAETGGEDKQIPPPDV